MSEVYSKQYQRDVAGRYRAPGIDNELIEAQMAKERVLTVDTGAFIDADYAVETPVAMHQRVPVHVSPRESGLAVVHFGAITDELARPENKVQRAVLAEQLDATIINVGTPGIEYGRWQADYPKLTKNKMSLEQTAELKAGSFRAIGTAMVRAAIHAMESTEHRGDSTVILAPSMAASVAAGGIHEFIKQRRNIAGAVFLDPVGIEPSKHRLRQFLGAGTHADTYLNMNHPMQQEALESTPAWISRAINSLGANWRYGRAAMQGRLVEDLLENDDEVDRLRESDVMLSFVAAGASEFNTAEPTQRIVRNLAALGLNAHYNELQDATHPVTMSTEAFVHTIRQITGPHQVA